MTQQANPIAERLARYYTEALCKNPKGTIAENMAFAVEQMPQAKAAPDLLTVAKLLHQACGIQANLLSTASEEERSEFINIIYDLCNGVAVPALEKARAI